MSNTAQNEWEKKVGITAVELREFQMRESLRESLDELFDKVAYLFAWRKDPLMIRYDKAVAFLNEVLAESYFDDYHLEENKE